jgi:hypothetical protein
MILASKPKQLANVLIKILGLSVLIHSIPGIIAALSNFGRAGTAGSLDACSLSSVLMAVVGFLLISNSRTVTERLFKNEPE